MADVSPLERMRRDVQRALRKAPGDRRWVMVVDIRRCIGCHACTVACKAENKTPPGIEYRRVAEVELGSFPDVQAFNMPALCMQCENPPCVASCPAGAISKRPDGIVEVDYERCTSCGKVASCPYDIIFLDDGSYYTEDTPALQPYETAPTYEYGKRWTRADGAPPIGTCRKCHYCLHRLDQGMLPACVTTCIGAANYFGDMNDPDSLVTEMMRTGEVVVFGPSFGTGPTTRYLATDSDLCAVCHDVGKGSPDD